MKDRNLRRSKRLAYLYKKDKLNIINKKKEVIKNKVNKKITKK